MIVKRIVRTEDGNIEATLMLTGEQAAFLMNVGLGALVQRGVATLQDFTPEEFEKHMQEVADAPAEGDTTPVSTSLDTPPSPAQSTPAETTVTPVKSTKEGMLEFLTNVDVDSLHKA